MRTVLLLMLALMASSARAADNFAVHVEPLFKQHCYRCHSHAAGVMKGGLTLDSRSGWAQGGDSGPAVVPGKPSESMLLKAVKHRRKKRYQQRKWPPLRLGFCRGRPIHVPQRLRPNPMTGGHCDRWYPRQYLLVEAIRSMPSSERVWPKPT